jgi:plastocyanin
VNSKYSPVLSAVFLLCGSALFCGTARGDSLSGKVTAGKGDSVVYLEGGAGAVVTPPAKHFVMDQKGLTFRPHILIVPVGASVDFLNSDKVQHNIFWPSISGDKKMSHNMGTWPTGEIRTFKYDKPGVVPLLCNVHPEMSGFIIVVPTEHAAETDASGNYKIDNLPPGQYTVTAWHEGMKAQGKPVTVAGDAKLDFALSK